MDPLETFDFGSPPGEPSLVSADSVAWRVFKNPLSLYIGGVAAVILELAEPRVRTGVWEHTTFRTDPLRRLRRTGLAAMVTVYGPRSGAEQMIAGVTRMHSKIQGQTPDGQAYRALEPELMDWVQATASFGFVRAYHRFVRPLSRLERDDFYAEGQAAAMLYGATGAPASEDELEALFAKMDSKLEPSPILFEFLGIMRNTLSLPRPLGTLQRRMVRAAIELVPERLRNRLGLGELYALRGWERRAIRLAGRAADRFPIAAAPPAKACARLGLPANYLY